AVFIQQTDIGGYAALITDHNAIAVIGLNLPSIENFLAATFAASSRSRQRNDFRPEIIPLSGSGTSSKGGGKEILDAGQIQADNSYRIMIRYQSGITADIRLLYENR